MAAGDRVTLGPAPPPALAAPLRLIHEDDSILVIEKPPGLLTIGTEHERERTAYRMVWAYLKGARPPRRPFIVHRLDRETSGLLVVAKTPEAQARLQGQFAAGNAERRYAAIVEGVVTRDEGMLRDVLIEERSLRVRPADPSRPPPKGRRARIAITWYRVTRAARRRDAPGDPPRHRAGATRSASRWRSSATRSSATPGTARAGTRSAASASTRRASASAIPTPGRPSSSTARRRRSSRAWAGRRSAPRPPAADRAAASRERGTAGRRRASPRPRDRAAAAGVTRRTPAQRPGRPSPAKIDRPSRVREPHAPGQPPRGIEPRASPVVTAGGRPG